MSDPRQVQPPRLEDRRSTRPTEPPFDPLQLCVFATVALLGWLLGPFALLGLRGARRSSATPGRRRAGLLRSKCKLGDTRLVLLYLVVLAVAAAFGIYLLLV